MQCDYDSTSQLAPPHNSSANDIVPIASSHVRTLAASLYPHDALLAQYTWILWLCVRLSITNQYFTKMANRRITQTTPRDSSSLTPNISLNSDGITPQQWRLFTNLLFRLLIYSCSPCSNSGPGLKSRLWGLPTPTPHPWYYVNTMKTFNKRNQIHRPAHVAEWLTHSDAMCSRA